jgi:hypothetical protein
VDDVDERQSATGNFTVSWAASGGASSYFLQEDTSATFATATVVYSGANTSHNVTGKTTGTWWYRVCANNTAGQSAWTTSTNGCQIVPPTAPPTITVPATSMANNATFTGSTVVYNGTNLTYNVTGKTTGTWYYRVRAIGVAGNSGWTVGSNGCQIVPPAAPATVTVPATSATGSYTVTWVASTGATGYDLEEDVSASFGAPTTVYTGANLTYNVTGKTNGTFYYRVRATNGAGQSGWTAGGNGCQIVPPNPPTPLTVPGTSTTGTYQVDWGSAGSGVSYELQEDTSSAFTAAATVYTGASVLYMVTGKNNGTYFYRVRASNGAGPSGWTTDTTGCAVTLAPPTSPVTVTVPATSSTGNFVVSWTGVTGAWGYDVEEATDAAFTTTTQVYTGSSLSYSVTGKANGTYYYRVRATNGAGQSGWTPGGNGCTVNQVAAGMPGFLTVPMTSSTGNFSVSWGTATGATLYELEEATASDFSDGAQVFRGASTSYQVTGKSDGTYYYRVRGVNVVGTSAWTVGPNPCTVTVSVPAAHVEAGPGNPSATSELAGALDVPMVHLRIRAGSAEDVQVQNIRVNAGGTGDDSTEISSVKLYRDVDGDGAIGGGDVQSGTGSFAIDDGNIDFDVTTDPPLTAGTEVHYLVVCDISGAAFTGSSFAFSVSVPAGVVCQGAVSMTGIAPTGVSVVGGLKTVATSGTGTLSVSLGGNTPVSSTVGYPSTGVSMLQVNLTASSLEGVDVSAIKFASGGSGDESSGLTARLIEDVDGDGQDSGGDNALATGVITGDNGTVEFTGLTLTVPASGSVTLLVVYDFGSGISEGTYGLSLEVGQDVEAQGSASSMAITASGAPLAGPTMLLSNTAGGGSGTGAVYFMGGCGAPVYPSTNGWAGLLLLLAAGIMILIRSRRTIPKRN